MCICSLFHYFRLFFVGSLSLFMLLSIISSCSLSFLFYGLFTQFHLFFFSFIYCSLFLAVLFALVCSFHFFFIFFVLLVYCSIQTYCFVHSFSFYSFICFYYELFQSLCQCFFVYSFICSPIFPSILVLLSCCFICSCLLDFVLLFWLFSVLMLVFLAVFLSLSRSVVHQYNSGSCRRCLDCLSGSRAVFSCVIRLLQSLSGVSIHHVGCYRSAVTTLKITLTVLPGPVSSL